MPTSIDKEAVSAAYEDVRDDNKDMSWLTLKFNGNNIELDSTGSEYDEFLARLDDDERIFGYVRLLTGDELSKRAKFAFITWAGRGVSTLKKAKMSVEKGVVKNIIRSFAIEILAEEPSEVSRDTVMTALVKAGGANYGTGSR